MKMFHRFCLLFIAIALLFVTEKATAQETFAPLLTENTVLFVHVDFSKVDLDLFKTEAKKLGETLLTTIGFDTRSQRETLRDLEVELEKLDTMFRPTFERITKELGIREIAWICDETLTMEHGVQFMLAVPWKGKTDSDFQKLLSALPPDGLVGNFAFPAGDFLFLQIVSFPVLNDSSFQSSFFQWVANAATDTNSPVLQALKNVNQSNEIKAVVRIPKSMRQELQNAPFPSDMPIHVRNLILFAATKIEWIAASVPVSELLTEKQPKDWRAVTVKMPNEEDAKMLREMMISAIDGGIPALQLQLESQAIHPSEVPPPLAFEFLKGFLRTLLPAVEGNTLIFSGDVKTMWRRAQLFDRSAMFLFLTRMPVLNRSDD